MDKYSVVWGVDVGHSSIKAVKLGRSGSAGVMVLGYAIEPITVGENGDWDEAVVKTMQHLAQVEEFGSTPVIASVSGRQIFSKTVNIPLLNPKKVERLVELEARQQIPGNFEEVEWGYHLSPAADGSSNDVALFAARREQIDELVRKSRLAGLNLVGVSVSSLALYNFVRFDQEFPEGEAIAILDVGAENTDLVVYQGDALWMRTLNLSGNDITKQFMKKFRVSFEEAENLKRQAGDSRQAEKIVKVIEGTLNELVGEVQRSLGFYKSQNTSAKIENVIISGNTFRLPGLPEYVAERLRYTINILEDLNQIQVAPDIDREHLLRDLQALGVSLGLALQGLGAAKANVNLLPSGIRLQKLLKSKRWAGAAAAVVLGGAVGLCWQMLSSIQLDNARMAASISKNYADHTEKVKASQATLDQVAPSASTIKSFSVYGTHQGLLHAVNTSVLGLIQDVVGRSGQINAGGKAPELGGDPQLQALYLESIELPAFAWEAEAGPFRPLAAERKAVVKVRIPVRDGNEALRALPQQLQERLRQMPRPDYLKDMVGETADNHLFGSVQVVSDTTGEDAVYNIDRTQVDEKTGQTKKIEEERRYPVRLLTFECTIPAVVAAEAVAATGENKEARP
jgi:type IV pilus assembly protein PilM